MCRVTCTFNGFFYRAVQQRQEINIDQNPEIHIWKGTSTADWRSGS